MSIPEAADSLTMWSRYRIGSRSLDQVLEHVAHLARQALAADVVVVTVAGEGDGPRSVVTTDPRTLDLDEVQYGEVGGPCLEAMRTGRTLAVPSLAAEHRWSTFARTAEAHGIRSTLSLPLVAEHGVLGVLNAYARQERAYPGEHDRLGEALAEQVALLLRHAGRPGDDLTGDLGSEAVVDYAVGILVAHGAHSTLGARHELEAQAERSGRPAAEVAAEIVESAEIHSRLTPEELARSYSELGSQLDRQRPHGLLDRVVRLATTRVPGAESASITIMRRGHFTTAAATDERARRADRLQYELGSGPCVSAAEQELAFAPSDLEADGRWPVFARRAAEREGVRSMLCYQIGPEVDDTVACLNLYASVPRAFDANSVVVGTLVAAHASAALVSDLERHRADQLQQALQSNREIGVAIGILMQQRKITREAAFDLLRVTSQHANRKLREVAADVADTGELPASG